MQKSDSIIALASALAKFQMEVSNPKNTASNPMFKSKYAPLSEVINTVKPILGKYGLSFIQSTGSAEESIIITTMLIHESGEWLESEPLTLPAYQLKSGGVKDFNAQGAGSAITYGRRYSLSAILGISSEDDDDGNSASHSPSARLVGDIKVAWVAKGQKVATLEPQIQKLYSKSLSELTEEQAKSFLDKLKGDTNHA